MARNKVMQLWTAFVTAFLALCTALGLVTTTATAAAAAPVPQTEPARNSSAPLTMPAAMPLWAWSHARSLPPTMKQRIHAEAHGKSPSCRHLPLTDTEDATASGPNAAPQTDAAPAGGSAAGSDSCGTGPEGHGSGNHGDGHDNHGHGNQGDGGTR